ncbi:MAG: DUF6115 domain-containing protein [bacterium]
MTGYSLFGIGAFLIFWGIFVLRPSNKRRQYLAYGEDAAEKMAEELELTAKTILAEIEEKSAAIGKMLDEGDELLQRIERIKEENITSISNNVLLEKQREIKKLLAEGHDLGAIAKLLDMGKGEIKLILDLSRGGK